MNATIPAPTITVELGEYRNYRRSSMKNVLDVAPRSGNDRAALVASLCAGVTTNGVQRAAIEHVIEMAIRHAGYSANTVDFNEIEVVELGKRVALNLRGFASTQHRDGKGRFLVAYDLQVFIGVRGGFEGRGRDGKKIVGPAAANDYDYFGKK